MEPVHFPIRNLFQAADRRAEHLHGVFQIRLAFFIDKEICRIIGKIAEKGYTLVPLRVYFKGSLVKVEIGLARGKKLYDGDVVEFDGETIRIVG